MATKDAKMADRVTEAVEELKRAYEFLQEEIEAAANQGLEPRVCLRLAGHPPKSFARHDRPERAVQMVGPNTGLDAKVTVIRRLV